MKYGGVGCDLPMLHSWAEDSSPLQLLEKTADKTETDPKAIACYGLWLKSDAQMLLRFVEQRPVSRLIHKLLMPFTVWL